MFGRTKSFKCDAASAAFGFVFYFSAAMWPFAVNAAAPPEKISINASVEFDNGQRRGVVSGQVRYAPWKSLETGERRCLYLPYNDANYDLDPLRDGDLIPRKMADVKPTRGHIDVTAKPGTNIRMIAPHLVEVVGSNSEITLEFSSQPPRWLDGAADEWFFADFYPQPLRSCPAATADLSNISFVPISEIDLYLKTPASWQIVTGAVLLNRNTDASHYKISARKLAFALVQGWQIVHDVIDGIPVEWVDRRGWMSGSRSLIEHSLKTGSHLFGRFPFAKLVLMGTTDLQKSALPGMVTINRPRAEALARLQEDASHWTEWQLALFVAEQWFGAGRTIKSYDDIWLVRGLGEFCAHETLRTAGRKYDLFRYATGMPQEEYKRRMNMNYRQVQDLQAGYLTFMQPFHTLTNEDFTTKSPFRAQYGLNYIRATLGFRQLYGSLGEQFLVAWRAYGKLLDESGEVVSPESLVQFMLGETSPLTADEKSSLHSSLQSWWMHDEWPDFKIGNVEEVERAPGQWQTRVEVRQVVGLEFPIAIELRDKSGRMQRQTVERQTPGKWSAQFTTTAPYDEIELDPDRAVFDWDRFNNKTRWTQMYFIPGDLRTFPDDAYTTAWLPLASKLPGESLTWLLAASTARYLHANYSVIGSYVPETKQRGFSLYYLKNIPRWGAYTVMSAIQDRGQTYRGERVLEGAIYKNMSFWRDPVLNLGLRFRQREAIVHSAETRHQTAAIKMKLSPLKSSDICRYQLSGEIERVIQASASAAFYDRRFSIAELNCKTWADIQLEWRVFAGRLMAGPDVETKIYFNPQEGGEARLRIDQPALTKVERIATGGADIILPMPIPLPANTLAVGRQVRLRGFYDYGQSWNPHVVYRDAGAGFWIPFGGDIAGKGSLQLVNLSVLAVLYRAVGDEESRKVGVLFDFGFGNN